MEVLAVIDAHDDVEQLLHRGLNGPNSFREWHDPSPALDAIIAASNAGIDLGPLLDSMAGIAPVKRRIQRHKEQHDEPRKRRRKKKLNLSEAERKRRSDEMKAKIAAGKTGGQFGKLGGRPRGS